ncbi:uncharacterized protein LOC108198785 isoform X1 [Daucus carota subsp. sativus]|uniref:uncharacterized protein LOC108198785 isoform X1 n=1 Tax=Daucus carota subsp. sativus TaxID=79200 RepID=UPI0030831A85
MSNEGSSDKSWRLFTSEDMIQGYKPKSVRKRKTSAEKGNISGNSSKRFTYPRNPLTPTAAHSVISKCTQTFTESSLSPPGSSNISSAYRRPDNSVAPSRTPLCNITNRMEYNTNKPGKPFSGTPKSKFQDTSRILFVDENSPLLEAKKRLQDDYIGLRNNSAADTTPDNAVAASRTPLSNITNLVEENNINPGKPVCCTAKSKYQDTTRTLFGNENSPPFEANKHLQDDEIGFEKILNRHTLFLISSFKILLSFPLVMYYFFLIPECSTIANLVFSESSDNDDLCDSSNDEDYRPGVDFDSDSDSEQRMNSTISRPVPAEYVSLGSPEAICSKCNARLWKEERTNKNVTKGLPIFSICCRKGDVTLPPTPPTPSYLKQLYSNKETGPEFQRSIRLYNAMFAFTSSGGKVDHSINNGRGPYVYRLNGQNHHVFGQLIPDDGKEPAYCQLYIYDTANEVNNRLRWVNVEDQQTVDTDVIQGLIQMLDETNELVAKFRMARDRWEAKDLVDLKVELKANSNFLPSSFQ